MPIEKTFCEFFAGIGLVHEALRHSGWQCTYANDVSAQKREMYAGHFGGIDVFHQEDIWKTAEILAHVKRSPFLATASFPCTDLSVAGHWRGLNGAESSTFFAFIKVLEELRGQRPLVVLLENVTGFLTSKNGEDFRTAITCLADLGYWMDAFVLDARTFVPQSRKRLFVVAYHESLDSALLVRKPAHGEGWADAWSDAINLGAGMRPARLLRMVQQWSPSTGWATASVAPPRQQRYDLAHLIDSDDEQQWWDQAAIDKHYDMMNDQHRRIVNCLLRDGVATVATAFRRRRHGKMRMEVRFDGVAGCLRTPRGGSAKQIVLLISGGKLRMRWMSPREYARLQGADDYCFQGRVSQALFGFGDAVCVPVVRWIDDHILSPVFESSRNHTSKPDGGQPYRRAAQKGHERRALQRHFARTKVVPSLSGTRVAVSMQRTDAPRQAGFRVCPASTDRLCGRRFLAWLAFFRMARESPSLLANKNRA